MKIVDWRFYDVNGTNLFKPKASDKSKLTLIYCKKDTHCNLLDESICIGFQGCPYANKTIDVGYTRKAAKSRSWSREKQELIKDIPQKNSLSKMKQIGNYIYFPYPHWNFNTKNPRLLKYERGLFMSNKDFIDIEDFYDIEFLKIVLDRQPNSIMGGTISIYQTEIVPKIISHLKEEFNDLYLKLITTYPKYEIKECNINYVGRKAKIKTLVPNVEFTYDKFIAYWNGTKLVIKNYPMNIMFIKDIDFKNKVERFIDFEIDVEDNDSIVIVNNKQCDKNTIFIN